jgi:hypothetical protein
MKLAASKRRLTLNGLHGVISHKAEEFMFVPVLLGMFFDVSVVILCSSVIYDNENPAQREPIGLIMQHKSVLFVG